MLRLIRRAGLGLALLAFGALAQGLPAEVEAALARAKLPREALTVLVTEVDGKAPPRVSHRPQVPVNPASVMKLVTTYAALDLLGPAFVWTTPVYMDGPVRDGVLQGNLYLRGQGDPKLVVERLWLLLRRVQGAGIQQIQGDIVLDHSAFDVVPQDPAAFDGEALRPYNAAPDALLVNFKSLVMTFVPERGTGLARVHVDPPLAGVALPVTVPASPAECGDWRGALKADFGDGSRVRFLGSYPASCGEKIWPVASADPRNFAARAIGGVWQSLGGKLGGQVRDGTLPPGLPPWVDSSSAPLAELVRDINKFSNNVMAQQLFLTLSLRQKGRGSDEGSRDVIRQWWTDRLGPQDMPLVDNGSGLSRESRVTAQAMARMLQHAWASPVMPELMSSLPISGVDGTLRRNRSRSTGAAHLKTGSLRDVTAIAGYVLGASGKRYVLVAIANHPNAGAARPALDALVEWTTRDL